jgi:hydroxymethylpyrimidine/phosphomethylpyrimidine kinase
MYRFLPEFDTPPVLAVAGVDPTGGAGLFADFETFGDFNVRGFGVVAALTAQTSTAFTGAYPVPGNVLSAEIVSVCESEPVQAVKVGMLGDAGNVQTVVDAIDRKWGGDSWYRLRNIVVDPVLRSTSGGELIDAQGFIALKERLIPRATVLTPNADEAGALLGRAAPQNEAEMCAAAMDLRALGAEWVLMKGGHVATGDRCVDVLVGPDGNPTTIGSPRSTGTIRGTGCRLSSAIAACLARGMSVPDACAQAHRHVSSLIHRSVPFRPIMEIA